MNCQIYAGWKSVFVQNIIWCWYACCFVSKCFSFKKIHKHIVWWYTTGTNWHNIRTDVTNLFLNFSDCSGRHIQQTFKNCLYQLMTTKKLWRRDDDKSTTLLVCHFIKSLYGACVLSDTLNVYLVGDWKTTPACYETIDALIKRGSTYCVTTY